MKTHQLFAKAVKGASSVAVGSILILHSVGCYTVNTNTNPEQAGSRALMVLTTDGGHVHYARDSWSVDQAGNINGRGGRCGISTTEYHDVEIPEYFSDPLEASRIQEIWTEEFDTGTFVLVTGGVTISAIALTTVGITAASSEGGWVSQ